MSLFYAMVTVWTIQSFFYVYRYFKKFKGDYMFKKKFKQVIFIRLHY